jgi:magnesium transporter
MILVNIPSVEEHSDKELYTTIPLSIIVTSESVITVCSEDTQILKPFYEGRVKDFHCNMKSRFILQVLYKTASMYLQYLRIIDKKSEWVENKLHKSTKTAS